MMGLPVGYNFDPITGQPLKPSTLDIFSLSSQPWDVLLPTSTSPHVTGLSNLPGLSQEERPLVVGLLSHSSRVVVGVRVPTVTVSSSAAEMALSSSPSAAPRVSTSSSNVTGGDVHRVIWQHLPLSPNRTLAGAGVRRGSARRPAKWNAGRGQVLVAMLADKGRNRGQELATKLKGNGAGRGQSILLPPMGRPEQSGRQADTRTKSSLPPPIMMHLDCQGPAVTYSKATSRLPQRTVVSPSELAECDV